MKQFNQNVNHQAGNLNFRSREHVVGVLGIALVFSLLLSVPNPSSANTPAPDFTLKSTTGQNLRLNDYRGQVVLLNFWASWCGPCRQEMPELEKIQQKWSKYGFTVLAVNVDAQQALADKFLQSQSVSFPVLYDHQNRVTQLFEVKAMPSTVLIDRNGIARHWHMGYQPGYELEYESQVKALIRE
ncbi:thiol-disulfide isomerase-like protein [Oleiphilus messinensis]|uniref:Thiol-disulfide isomerase-like protein n=1 Tax=Oleiphilus messinensis TaxID=141451 RepID=A0A1Y0IAE8_9GAMM|nr:TlpA disulfide reductase family protein [Oleiphilus messinensis]ARU56373.1 thiol-disulfide isomerase-like protein [Oleiphilus messinensis]